MATVRSRQLTDLIVGARSASDPDVKRALVGLAAEVKERLSSGDRESHDFFLTVTETIQEIRGNAHARIRADCLFECCQFFYLSGKPVLGLYPARQMVRLVEYLQDKRELRRAHNLLGILCADTGDLGEAIEHYAVALRIARDMNDDEAEAPTWMNLGTALAYMSRYQEALGCLEVCHTKAPQTPVGQKLRKKAVHNMSLCYFNLGDLENARLCSEESLRDEEPTTSGDLYSRIVREQHYLEALLELGQFELARKRVEYAATYALRANTLRATETVQIMRGLVDAYCGDALRGTEALEGLAVTVSGTPMIGLDVLRALARAYEKAGNTEKALDCLQEMLRVNKRRREEGALAHLAIASSASSAHFRSQFDLASLHQRQAELKVKLAEKELIQSQIEVLERLAVTADLREEDSGEHGFRVGRLAALFAKELGWSPDDCLALEQAARLHDIGKVGIPDRILLSSEVLQESERRLMSAHALIGADLLSKSNIPKLMIAEEIARCHHEWWDGTGYPAGLSGNRIPRHARIVALADVFDALTHGRTYEKPWPVGAALAEIENQRGRQFDPELADRFLAFMRPLIASHPDLDEYLGKEAGKSGVLQARHKIRSMLSGSDPSARQRRFDLATSKS